MAALNLSFLDRFKPQASRPTQLEKFISASGSANPTPDLIRVLRAYQDTQKKRA